jgi:hypothetical protein
MSLRSCVHELVENLLAKPTVLITGPGLSLFSGITPPSETDQTVDSAALEKSIADAQPSLGHDAIARAALRCPKLRVITQCIDGLHSKTADLDQCKLIEVLGRFGSDNFVAPESDAASDPSNWHQWEQAKEWIAAAEVLVLVGTSCASKATVEALKFAALYGLVVYNFNAEHDEVFLEKMSSENPDQTSSAKHKWAEDVHVAGLVTGLTEQTLPLLAWNLERVIAMRATVAALVNMEAQQAPDAVSDRPLFCTFASKRQLAPDIEARIVELQHKCDVANAAASKERAHRAHSQGFGAAMDHLLAAAGESSGKPAQTGRTSRKQFLKKGEGAALAVKRSVDQEEVGQGFLADVPGSTRKKPRAEGTMGESEGTVGESEATMGESGKLGADGIGGEDEIVGGGSSSSEGQLDDDAHMTDMGEASMTDTGEGRGEEEEAVLQEVAPQEAAVQGDALQETAAAGDGEEEEEEEIASDVAAADAAAPADAAAAGQPHALDAEGRETVAGGSAAATDSDGGGGKKGRRGRGLIVTHIAGKASTHIAAAARGVMTHIGSSVSRIVSAAAPGIVSAAAPVTTPGIVSAATEASVGQVDLDRGLVRQGESPMHLRIRLSTLPVGVVQQLSATKAGVGEAGGQGVEGVGGANDTTATKEAEAASGVRGRRTGRARKRKEPA